MSFLLKIFSILEFKQQYRLTTFPFTPFTIHMNTHENRINHQPKNRLKFLDETAHYPTLFSDFDSIIEKIVSL